MLCHDTAVNLRAASAVAMTTTSPSASSPISGRTNKSVGAGVDSKRMIRAASGKIPDRFLCLNLVVQIPSCCSGLKEHMGFTMRAGAATR